MALDGTRVVLHADKEHDRLRLAVLAVLVVGFAAALLVLNAFISSRPPSLWVEYAFFLSCAGALPLALGMSALAEYWMKRNWHSGRSVTVDDAGIAVKLEEGEPGLFEWSKNIYATRWYFSLKGFPRGGRERRVPAGWFCLACQLQQDEWRLVVYSYMPEKKAIRYLSEESFHELKPGNYFDTNPLRRRFGAPKRPEIPTKVLTGKEGPYWLAERRRWEQGLELVEEDFAIFLKRLAAHVAE